MTRLTTTLNQIALLSRDPRWGRNLETPGEDPYLNGQYGQWHTQGLQEGEDKRYLQAVVTLKHWDAYSLEDNGDRSKGITRHTFDAKVSKEDLAGTYFPAFKQAVRGGNAKGVMCSYNAVNGVPSCASKFLLQTVLRDAWNFSGYVTSDSGAVEDIYRTHHYQNFTAEQGVAAAVLAGCDIDSSLDKGHTSSGSPYTWSLGDALNQSLIKESDVDALLARSLKMRFELGLFDPIEDQPYWQYKVGEAVAAAAAAAVLATQGGEVSVIVVVVGTLSKANHDWYVICQV
jgi:beta-glucosidase-like glycosyl hydrolase